MHNSVVETVRCRLASHQSPIVWPSQAMRLKGAAVRRDDGGATPATDRNSLKTLRNVEQTWPFTTAFKESMLRNWEMISLDLKHKYIYTCSVSISLQTTLRSFHAPFSKSLSKTTARHRKNEKLVLQSALCTFACLGPNHIYGMLVLSWWHLGSIYGCVEQQPMMLLGTMACRTQNITIVQEH